ncbi:hypothetical protein GIB67_017527 [Kingdonia uniflora]|uniref:SKP1 component POZ domain-containing protein n=1 Tax=Kingdonia uniflora TaxID=39325 RepID=A0A7J7M4V1_9MAGN|nr:hypothetical protein GIB67_017527 [Kingdonia uniflora]
MENQHQEETDGYSSCDSCDGPSDFWLVSAEGKEFLIQEEVAMEMNIFKLNYVSRTIVLLDVSSEIVPKVIEYCKWQANARKEVNPMGTIVFKMEFLNVSTLCLVDLANAAECLQIKDLLELTSGAVAYDVMVKATDGLTIKQILDLNCATLASSQDVLDVAINPPCKESEVTSQACQQAKECVRKSKRKTKIPTRFRDYYLLD